MSNDQNLIKLENPRGSLLRKILSMTVILVIVVLFVAMMLFPEFFNVDAMRRWVKYMNVRAENGSGVFEFDAHNSNRYANFDGGLAVASVGGLSTYQSGGAEAIVSQGQLSLPEIQSGKKLVMAYDVGGTTLLAVNNRSGEVLRVTSDKAILDADLSENGSICYVSGSAGYKTVLTVYNEKQECVYRWLSSSTYMPLCAVSDDGDHLATVGLNQSGGSFESELNLFRTDSEVIANTVSLGNELVYDLLYFNSDTICAIGEETVQFLSSEGEPMGIYDYNGSYLKDYDVGGDGFLTLSLNMYRAGNRYTVVTVDEAGQELGSLYIGEEILDLSACGKYIAVLTPDNLTVYTRDLQVYAQTMDTGTATGVLMREDGSVLLLGSGIGELYVP